MFNMRHRVLLYVVHFVICFLYMRMEMLTLSLNIEIRPYQNGSVLQCVRDLLFVFLIQGVGLRLCS